jgi:hypothetical protein
MTPNDSFLRAGGPDSAGHTGHSSLGTPHQQHQQQQDEEHPENEPWYDMVENVTRENAMDVVASIHKLISKQKDAIQNNASYEAMKAIANKIERKAKILENNSFFVREGDLIKLNRAGREAIYRFFLFSDVLIYCHQGISGEYKVHGTLPLQDMQIFERDTDPTRCSISIKHPVKSFIVVAESVELKYAWFTDIEKTISNCRLRRVNNMKDAASVMSSGGSLSVIVHSGTSTVAGDALGDNNDV